MGYVVTVRYFAAARAAAGVTEERTESATLADAGRRGCRPTTATALAKVLGVASFLVDGVAWHDRDAALPAGATVDVLPALRRRLTGRSASRAEPHRAARVRWAGGPGGAVFLAW